MRHLVRYVMVGEQYIAEEVLSCCKCAGVDVSLFAQCRGGLRTRSAPAGSRSFEASAGAVTKVGDNSSVVIVDASYGPKRVVDVVDDLGRGGRSGVAIPEAVVGALSAHHSGGREFFVV